MSKKKKPKYPKQLCVIADTDFQDTTIGWLAYESAAEVAKPGQEIEAAIYTLTNRVTVIAPVGLKPIRRCGI